VDFRQKGDQVLQAAAKAIDRSSHDDIELAASRRFMQGIECWPLVFGFGAADAVIAVDVNNLPPGPLGDLA
jgi:hypothetical protein